MSYNISRFITKSVKNLSFPVDALFSSPRKDWHPDRKEFENGTTEFQIMESTLYGTVVDNIFHITDIYCCGEGSGFIMDYIISPALKESKGQFIASCVWEGGDTINQLRVSDGDVKWVNIEI